MVFGFWLTMIVLIICISILFGCYMFCCYDNDTKMFSNPDKEYEKRISKLEQEIEQIKIGNKIE